MMFRKTILSAVAVMCSAATFAQTTYTLDECKQAALQNNTAIKNSQLDYDMALQTKREALTHYFPTVSAMGAYFRSNNDMMQTKVNMTGVNSTLGQLLGGLGIDPTPIAGLLPSSISLGMLKNGTVAGITAVQPVFAGGQIVNGNKLARVGVDASRLQQQRQKNDVNLKTEEYFWQIVSLKEKLHTVDVVTDMLGEIHRNVQNAVDAGVTNRNDLLRVELQEQDVASKRLKVENGIRVMKLLLRHQTGVTDNNFDVAFTEFPIAPEPSEYRISAEEGVDKRVEMALLDKSVEAATLRKRMAVGKNMPSIGIGAGYMYHNLLEKDTDFGVIFAAASVPISAWWGGSYAIKKSRLEEQKAENSREDARQMMIVDIESKWSALEEAYAQIALANKSIEQATENLRINNDSYMVGTSTLSVLLEAQTLLQQSMDSLTDANVQYRRSLSEYMTATGRE